MTRLTIILCSVLALMLSVGLFRITYQVDALEKDLKAITQDIRQEQETIHILEAEWSYLNDPNRLADLTKRYLEMDYTLGGQLIDFDALNDLAPAEPADETAPISERTPVQLRQEQQTPSLPYTATSGGGLE